MQGRGDGPDSIARLQGGKGEEGLGSRVFVISVGPIRSLGSRVEKVMRV